jgi:hypothetical protein
VNEGKRVAHVYPRKLSGVRRRFSFVSDGVRTWHTLANFDEAKAKSLRGMVRP